MDQPLEVVWHKAKDFFDLRWFGLPFQVEKVDDSTRVLRLGPSEIAEKLLEYKETQDHCSHLYDVKINKGSSKEVEIFFSQCKVENRVEFYRDGEGTKFNFQSAFRGPYNLIKLNRAYFDQTYASPFPNLVKHLNAKDLVIDSSDTFRTAKFNEIVDFMKK